MTLQAACDIIQPIMDRLKMTLTISGQPDAHTGTIRLIDRKGRHAGTITVQDGVALSVVEVRQGSQNLLGSVARAEIRDALRE